MPDRLIRLLEEDDDDNRRADGQTRRRVKEITAGLVAWAQAIDRRQRRATIWTMTTAVLTLVAVAVGYALLQGQRYDATLDGCDARNQQAQATVGLLRDLGVQPRVILVAQVRYPHTPPLAHRKNGRILPGPPEGYDGPMTCREYAEDRVGPFRL